MGSNTGNVAPVDETNSSNLARGANPNAEGNLASQEIVNQASSVDSFYVKLCKLFESSGLSLLFNFRETTVDLYVFYKEVTERGGFHLVTKDGKWVEVASTLDSKNNVSMSPTQLQKLYAHLLYEFEQIYHYRTPAHAASGKRNHGDISPFLTVDLGIEDSPTAKKKCSATSNGLSTGPTKQKVVVQTPPKKETKKDPNAPLRARSAYQMYLRNECDRLKKFQGETSGSQNVRIMAIDAWRHFSESDRQPYVEESRKDKERFNREMTAYKVRKNIPGKSDGAYKVTVQSAPGNPFIADVSAAELASRLMKNREPNGEEPIFQINQINWDAYCGSLDIPI